MSLATKYRPTMLREIVGQRAVLTSIKHLLEEDSRPHTFLFSGPSGVGKTTLARVIANIVGEGAPEILEYDAATHTGIDHWRTVQESLPFKPRNGTAKVVIVDECHRLSANAWESLLKITEEPPRHVYWFFCTTVPGKVPKAIHTRCASYELGDVSMADLRKLAAKVLTAEAREMPDEVVSVAVAAADGSPRQLLANLQAAWACETADAARELMRASVESAEVIELVRALSRGAPWHSLMAILARIPNPDPEGIRRVIQAYTTKVVMGARDVPERDLAILDAFSKPFYDGKSLAPVLVAIGEVMSGGE